MKQISKEHMLEFWKNGLLNTTAKDELIKLLLNENRALDKAIEEMKKVPQEFNPKVKQRGYSKK